MLQPRFWLHEGQLHAEASRTQARAPGIRSVINMFAVCYLLLQRQVIDNNMTVPCLRRGA